MAFGDYDKNEEFIGSSETVYRDYWRTVYWNREGQFKAFDENGWLVDEWSGTTDPYEARQDAFVWRQEEFSDYPSEIPKFLQGLLDEHRKKTGDPRSFPDAYAYGPNGWGAPEPDAIPTTVSFEIFVTLLIAVMVSLLGGLFGYAKESFWVVCIVSGAWTSLSLAINKKMFPTFANSIFALPVLIVTIFFEVVDYLERK